MSDDLRTALLLFVAVASVYFATVTGVTSSNDGSHYALTRAIADGRGWEISPYLDFTEDQDYATRDGRYFSDRPPGTALIAAPLYALGTFLPDPLVDVPSKHDPGNAQMLYAVMLAPLAMAGAVTLFYGVVRRAFGISRWAALLGALAFAFGTIAWKYGSVLYSHALAALVIWGAVALILHMEETGPTPGGALGLGLLLGCAPLTEYTSGLFTLIGGVYAVLTFRSRVDGWLVPALFVLGGLIPAELLAAYNTVNFGGPLQISRFYADTTLWPENEDLGATFSTPIPQGLLGLLVYGSENQGIFLLSPVTLLALPGLVPLFRRDAKRALLIVGTFAAFLLLFSASTTFNAGTDDGRYLATGIGLWMVPLAVWLDEQEGRLLPVLATGVLLALSVRAQLMHIAYSWNYDLTPQMLAARAADPANIGLVLRTAFPNVLNLPLLWLVIACGGAVAWLASRRRDPSVGRDHANA
ncbi:MAG: hypothetical protein ACFB51_18675 [Anaerolineae bacterium]